MDENPCKISQNGLGTTLPLFPELTDSQAGLSAVKGGQRPLTAIRRSEMLNLSGHSFGTGQVQNFVYK